MDYKFLVLDIDGTATNSQKEVTPITREAVIRLQETGIPVAIASGRPTPGVAPIADIFDFEKYGSYTLCYNGEKITNWKTKECVYQKTLPIGLTKSLFQEACHFNVGILTYSPDETKLFCGRCVDQYMELESRICNLEIIDCGDDFVKQANFPTVKFIFTGDPADLEAIEPILAEKYKHEANIFRSEPFFLEVLPKNVEKAYCLSKLLPILGIAREEMICCGDSYNDLTMIQYAGLGVAMANAKKPVKDIADFITLSNDEDGVAHVIEKFFHVSPDNNI